MHKPFFIKKVAVLGAGVMGAQIAAHCVNAGIETLLFDLASKDADKNSLVNKAIAHLSQLKPSPLASAGTSAMLQARNYEENLSDLADCDLVIEAIAERLDLKEMLYKNISSHIAKETFLVSNTSGLSINELSSVLPEKLRSRFCGVHFFNPPRYMHLAELIPSKETSSELLDHLESWLTSYLGKGVVRAKDTPNFIANRVGVFSLLSTIHHAEQMELGLDEVDALTGVLLGRPKSATFRTMDVVGLDTMVHVVKTMSDQLKEDPWHSLYNLPDWLMNLVKEGHLGQKTGQGIYRKQGKTIEVYDRDKKDYRPSETMISEELQAIMQIKDPAARMEKLLASKDKQAQFLTACFKDLFHYCAYHLQGIAQSVRDVDLAIRWGFGWQQGPFETWQLSGYQRMVDAIESSIKEKSSLASVGLPDWMKQIDVFYNQQGAYSPQQESYLPRSDLPVYKKQFFPERVLGETTSEHKTLYENEGVRLWHLKDEVAVVSFKSKANTIGQAVLDGLLEAMNVAQQQCKGLIIYQQDAGNFSSGANLKEVMTLIKDGKMQALNEMIEQFQRMALGLKYSSIPTVAAVRGRALGGGCEMLLHCDAVVAAFESYPGLVELGVGVIPAGGGCKEMARRAAERAQYGELMDWIQPYFQQIATGAVAGSAVDAQRFGYFRTSDQWVMNAHEVLSVALAKVEQLQASNYQPPLPARFQVAGREGNARLQTGLVNWLEGGYISDHDYYLANQLSQVICGGDVYAGEWVDEAWMLKLEREAFVDLCSTEKTQERMNHLLETGKPLRN